MSLKVQSLLRGRKIFDYVKLSKFIVIIIIKNLDVFFMRVWHPKWLP